MSEGAAAISHAELDELDLAELVDRLDDLEDRRTPIGWSPDDAVQRVAIERRIMDLVGHKPPAEERRKSIRLPCDLSVKMRSKEQTVRATVNDIGLGGVFVATDAQFVIGTVVELEVRGGGTDEHGLRVRGEVAWQDDDGFGVAFSDIVTAAHERRLRRFVIELLRHRTHS